MPFKNAIAGIDGTLVISQLRSQNYVATVDGWRIGRDGSAEFQDIILRGTLGVDTISAETIVLNGTDITDTIDEKASGKVISARLAQMTNPVITNTITKMFEINCGVVPGGRTYRIKTEMLITNTGATATTDRITFTYWYTIDGTSPVAGTGLAMDGGFNDTYKEVRTSYVAVEPDAEIDVLTDSPLKIGLAADLTSGAGTYSIYAGASARSRPVMTLYDDGPSGKQNDSAITLTGGGVSTYTKTFDASWALGSNGSSVELDNSWIWQGADGINNYNFGLVGFDSAAIVAALAGVVTPTSLTLKYFPRSRSVATGLDSEIISHNYASLAAAKAVVGGVPINYFNYGAAFTLMTTKLNAVPAVSQSVSLGTTVFNQFKAATKKGVGFSNPSLDTGGNGSVFGDGASQCQLVFVYQGTS